MLHVVFGFDFLELLTRQWRAQGLLEKTACMGSSCLSFGNLLARWLGPMATPSAHAAKNWGCIALSCKRTGRLRGDASGAHARAGLEPRLAYVLSMF